MSTTEDMTVPEGRHEASFAFQGDDSARYRRVMGVIAATPWAMRADKLAALVDVLAYRSAGHRLTAEEIDERIGGPVAARQAASSRNGDVAVLRLMGIIAPRASNFQSVSSPNGTSVENFTKALRSAIADPDIGSILIEIDSPGGSVAAVPELGEELRKARSSGKPIVGHANGMAASAAYWIGAQVDELVVTPSGEVGSIGVYAAHEDWSAYDEKFGVKTTLISAGKFKVEGNPFEPLSEEARAAIQADVDSFYSMFLDAVAKGRGVAKKTVLEDFGHGRMLLAKDALAAGMVDRIETFDETVKRMLRGKVAKRSASAEQAADGGILAAQTRLSEALDTFDAIEASEDHEPAPAAAVEPVDEPRPARSVEDMKTILGGSR